ncbi:MAG: acetylornithine transaminase, partial [Gemmatimonadaceae bacterium]|nr:acetylornithine transaminase [Gemmatimonadaceae bacterium]
MTSTMLSPESAPFTPAVASKPDATPLPAILGTYKRQAPLFVRGDGVYMYDEAGTRYLDFVSG